MPLVNEAVIPLGVKDTFNSLEPTGDGAALSFVTNPMVPPLLEALFGLRTPPTPRNDLVTIFLTGIPGLNQIGTSPRGAEMIRLNKPESLEPGAVRTRQRLLFVVAAIAIGASAAVIYSKKAARVRPAPLVAAAGEVTTSRADLEQAMKSAEQKLAANPADGRAA